MTDNDDRIDGLDAWEPMEPPSGFADRVLASRDVRNDDDAPDVATRKAPSRVLTVSAVVVGIACVGALAIGLTRSDERSATSGTLDSTQRETVALGHRGVAVVEPGARVQWKVAGNGATEIQQDSGNVFYRVDRGGAFEVDTPAGRVDVTGTCFRVEVNPMRKQTLIGAGVGAALAATLVVTVYEGRLLFANDSGKAEAKAGETIVVGSETAPTVVKTEADPDDVADIIAPAPADDITRDDLLVRDEQQRKEIAALKSKMKKMQHRVADGSAKKVKRGGPRTHDEDGRPWFDPSPEALKEFAEECRVRYDTPPVTGMKPMQFGPERGGELGLTAEELSALNQVMTAMHAAWRDRIRDLYIEATGDNAGADQLSSQAMQQEINDKGAEGEMPRVQKLIAWERAGMVEPPADWSSASPVERFYRMLSQLGDEMQVALGDRIGAERAKFLREKNGGWGRRMEYAGCPDDDEATMDIER
jgi:hypothetical protein